jgi:diguanylate cyclase (GGDEF)-like protein/PAS domain S-box-containing protein
MGTLPPRSLLIAGGAAVLSAAWLPQAAGWAQPERAFQFAGLVLAAIVAAAPGHHRWTSKDRAIMPPSFVITFSSLLLFDRNVAMLVALAAAVTPAFLAPMRAAPWIPILVDAGISIAAIQLGGLTYESMGRLVGDIVWPWHAIPVAAAVVAYHVVQGALAEIVVPLLSRKPVSRTWPARALRGCPMYLVGASVAVLLVEVIERRLWAVLPVMAASLYFAYQVYADYVARLQEDLHRREVIDFLEQGMSVVDVDGHVTLWNDALERMVGCSRERALRRRLVDVVPALRGTEVPRSIDATLKHRTSNPAAEVRVGSGADARVLQVRILPVARGAALLWRDVTERTIADRELRQTIERLTLAAEGANDGLWQWSLATGEFYVTGRWRAMLGLPADAAIARPEDWLGRVHQDDVSSLKTTLEAHFAGNTEIFQHEHRIRHEDGSYRRFLCRGQAVKGAGRRRDRIAGSFTDTTDQAIAEERLRTVGFLDPLTGLVNRGIFVEGLGRRLDEFASSRVNNSFAVLYLDLDRFKIVNDSLGHLVGDELLVAASRRLESCLRPGDALARLGGDEFAILLNGLGDDAQANAIALRIQHALRAPFSIGGREVFTSASIGIAFGPAHYSSPEEMMRDADTAMYHAKARGKARHEVFDADMHARVRDRLSLENDLRRAITGNDFEVHYQPIVSLVSGMCVGFESLIRWTRDDDAVSPATFIPIAEELGLIEPVGTWVLQEACQTFADWQRRFPAAGLECITVNVSSRQLLQQKFARLVQQAVHKAGLKPADLRLEITETALMDSPGEAAEALRELRSFGVKIYLDDFGTGYSSLSHLHNLPVDALKIDRSFVKSILLPGRPAIVESILALARTLNTSVVAEGIENEIQARELERLGCTHAQGFLFSRPLSAQAAAQLIAACRPLGPKGNVGSDRPPVANEPVTLARV